MKTKILSPLRRDGYKAGMIMMLIALSTMLLTTACSSDDDLVNNENTATKGYALPVTVNVTRQGDATTRATYNESTRKLEFSAGDKLFVEGSATGAGGFAGTLDYDTESEKFSGTIYTQSPYEGTIDDLLSGNHATLLPAGYESYDYLEIIEYENEWEALLGESVNNSFATSKKLAVEQLSFETGEYTSGTGFVLNPCNAILNFTITGLTPSTKVTASLSDGSPLFNIEGDVTTDGSGNATFAMGVFGTRDLNELSLTVAGNPITLVNSSKTLTAGKIYNITRSAAPAATSLSELKTAINGGTDCSSYIGWEVNSEGAIAESGISGTKIGYVAYVSTSDVDAGVSGSRILVIASADAAVNTTWGSKGTSRDLTADDLNGYSNTNTLQDYGAEAHPAADAAWNYSATIPSGGATPAHWFMPTKKQWENMRDAKGGTYSAMAAAYGISSHYWTSTEVSNNNAWRFVTNNNMQSNVKSNNYNVRSIFAY